MRNINTEQEVNFSLISSNHGLVLGGRLKVREWKMREQIARVENGGVSRMESQTENIFSVTSILTAIRF